MATSSTTTDPGSPVHGTGRRVLISGLAAVVAVLLAITVYAFTRPATVWDRTTPEGTVQAYVSALLDGDVAGAAALLAPDGPCTAPDLDRTSLPAGTQVNLTGSTVPSSAVGSQAQVRVRVRFDPGGQPLGAGGEDHTFRLTRTTSGWRIDGIPWPLYDCIGG